MYVLFWLTYNRSSAAFTIPVRAQPARLLMQSSIDYAIIWFNFSINQEGIRNFKAEHDDIFQEIDSITCLQSRDHLSITQNINVSKLQSQTVSPAGLTRFLFVSIFSMSFPRVSANCQCKSRVFKFLLDYQNINSSSVFAMFYLVWLQNNYSWVAHLTLVSFEWQLKHLWIRICAFQ